MAEGRHEINELRRLSESNVAILKGTLCHVGAHVWVWSGGNTVATTEPPEDAVCDCCMFMWKQANKASR